MAKYRIIGNMTGNSMDAMDFVLTEFDGHDMRDICAYSKPYTKEIRDRMAYLRQATQNKTRDEIAKIADFQTIHDDYIVRLAECIDEMCKVNHIEKNTVDAIGFHGKTLDHNPPSVALKNGTAPYTLQIGSGQMLADLTGLPVVYDFRSDFLMAGFDGAPLVAPHNAHIAKIEGDGCYYNGGNTSNFALIKNGIAELSADAGPFNEYIDGYIREHTAESFDKDGMFGKNGKVNAMLLQKLFDFGRTYYETPLPKSGDPAYYHGDEVLRYIREQSFVFVDAVRTLEHFSAYIAVQALSLVPDDTEISNNIILFGGGWKNPVVRKSFEALLHGTGFILPEHQQLFSKLYHRFVQAPAVRFSMFGEYMEARAFADLARYKLENKAWEIPETIKLGQTVVCGVIARPQKRQEHYTDCIKRAAKGWQQRRV